MKAIRYTGENDMGIPPQWPAQVIDVDETKPIPEGYTALGDELFALNRRAAFERVDAIATEKVNRLFNLDQEPHIASVRQLHTIARAMRAIRREAKGQANAGEINFLNAIEARFATAESIRAYADTLKADYDAGRTPDIRTGWPT